MTTDNNAAEIEIKTERLVRLIHENECAGLIINSQHNFAWLTCGGRNGIDQTRDNGASFIFVGSDGKRFLIANNIECSRNMLEEVPSGFEPLELSWKTEKASPDSIVSMARKLATRDGEIVADLAIAKDIRSIEPAIAKCRSRLTPNEQEQMRSLGADAADALADLVPQLVPGDRELDIARKVRSALEQKDIFPVVTLVGADERLERFRHPVPTANIWGETLLIAICGRRRGLITSLSRMFTVGDVASELARKTVAAGYVSAQLQAATVPGAKASDLYRIAAEAYEHAGFPGEIANHHQGGATGYRTREWLAHPASTDVVVQDQAFAWNPSISGTKVEVTGMALGNGFTAVTPTNGFPEIVHVVDGREYNSAGVLSLARTAHA